MKIKMMLPLTMAGLFAASAASAQVAASFDNLVDQVLSETSSDFISASVNLSGIDGSIDITAGSAAVPGSSAASSASEAASEAANEAASSIDLTEFTNTNNTVVDESSEISGSFDDTAFNIDQTISNDVTVASSAASSAASDSASAASSSTTEAVTQSFGDVSSVAAGAINDSTGTFTETGALASVDIASNTASTAFDGLSSNTTGAGVGSVNTAVNLGGINGSISMGLANANVEATSIGSVAAGSINTSEITATFVGGSDAEADLNTGP